MRILVIGDVLLDVDVGGAADRLSPDAPVPVVDVESRSARPGGAGLVARMLARDGHDVTLVTALSDDDDATELRAALGGIELVAGASGAPTPVKTRVAAGGHPLIRIDRACAPPPPPEVTDEMVAAVARAEVILAADYGRGLLADHRLRRALDDRSATVPLVWDPHPRGTEPVSSADLVTPNLAEARAASGASGSGIELAAQAAIILRERWHCRGVVVTLGADGALLMHDGHGPLVVPAPRIDAGDPCGAGDRFAAGAAVALGSGSTPADAVGRGVEDAAQFLAAGGVRSLRGPQPPRTLPSPAADALRVAHRVRESGGTLVATGGCFDLLHAGHARTLAAARALGDALIVCLNSDSSVRRLKGSGRPIIQEEDRINLLLSLECVDAVLVFDESTPDDALRRIRPHVWVKGGDYDAASLPEAATIADWGGRIVTVPYHRARSTSGLAAALARIG